MFMVVVILFVGVGGIEFDLVERENMNWGMVKRWDNGMLLFLGMS